MFSKKKLLATLLLVACDIPLPDFLDSTTGTTITTTSSSTGVDVTGDPPANGDTTGPHDTSCHDTTTGAPEPPDTTTGAATNDTTDTTTGPVEPRSCDPWLEDCLEGEKCISHTDDGIAWKPPTCAPLVGEPDGVGEPCSADPVDSCGEHAMCWHIDPDTGLGTCEALCSGSADEPACDAGDHCYQASSGNLAVCLPACSPIEPSCSAGDICIPRPYDATVFVCVPDRGGDEGQAFDDCETWDVCDPGLGCMNVAFASECDGSAVGCCLPFCDLTEPNTCPGQGQVCFPWYEPGYAPPGLEDVGLCRPDL